MGTYVYAFARTSHPLMIEGMRGVGAEGPPLRVVRQGDLAAVVSDAPEDLRAKRRDLEAHNWILEALGDTGAVLPMRFGTVAPDDAAVQAELAADATRYLDLLSDLDGRVELNLKAAHKEDAVLRDLLLHHQPLRDRNEALRAAGGDTQQDRIEFGERVAAALEERRAEDADRVVAALAPHAVALRLGPSVAGSFVNASFLVADDTRDAFDAALNALRGELATYATLDLYGPLPPYSFVTEDEPSRDSDGAAA
jgi:hypothetical protein